ncbi:DUF4192 domain-containing protein [Streptomyces sp. Ru73]|uniref:DUF4192 domain-containing protein n=1 Tax=Streptomyces sp. Ru73 TaxID=2080748 RepID=UPI000CDD7042|nr:DUF4192 domain-containing protein [Streptomyces sp. Ru73]POX41054.1 DUF4192 domain-containing protein [Streptomyces sp. Ru73]
MTHHIEPANPADPRPTTSRNSAEAQVTLRGPAELADALPYLLGFYPDDSIVLVALHGERGRFGGRVRLGIPTDTTQWPYIADQLADCLITSGRERGTPPSGIIAFLCQEPTTTETGRDVRDRLQPLAQRLRTACGSRDVPVYEALCISNGHFWSYVCPDERCCPAAGTPLAMPGTSVMAAAAAYSGVQVRGSLKDMEARLAPFTGTRAGDQIKALDAAAAALIPRMLSGQDPQTVREETVTLLARALRTFRDDPPSGSHRAKDACDDALLSNGEAAEMILGLQDRLTRDRVAAWMEGPDAAPALRLWRALARRCPDAYQSHAAAPLTLAGWVSWATGDTASARVALCRALTLDPDYLFAQLLHRGLNEGIDPEKLRSCLRATLRPAVDTTPINKTPADTTPMEKTSADRTPTDWRSAVTDAMDTSPIDTDRAGTDPAKIVPADTVPEPDQTSDHTPDTPDHLPTSTTDEQPDTDTTGPRTTRARSRRPRADRPAGPRARTRPEARPRTGRPHPRTGPTGGRRDDRSPR